MLRGRPQHRRKMLNDTEQAVHPAGGQGILAIVNSNSLSYVKMVGDELKM